MKVKVRITAAEEDQGVKRSGGVLVSGRGHYWDVLGSYWGVT